MAIIGFIACVVLAAYLIISGVVMWVMSDAFGSVQRSDYAFSLLFIGLGAWAAYGAYLNAPFNIIIK